MIKPTPFHHHGGALDAAAQRTGIPAARWLDLSTGINPHPYPVPTLDPQVWSRLPEQESLDQFKDAVVACYGLNSPEVVVATPGTQAAIQWLPRLIPPTTVAVLSPTYGEHVACWRLGGHNVLTIPALERLPEAARVLVVVQPNNPTGTRQPREDLLDLAAQGVLVVVDEAFADPHPELSLAPRVGFENLVVLRSFGKFFGLAGLRLGVVLAVPTRARQWERAFGPWAVSGPALTIGTQALGDGPWIAATRAALSRDSERLAALLQQAGLEIIGGTALFQLARHPDAAALFERLCQAAILTRPFPEAPDWLRFGLPGSPEDWQRLTEALRLPSL
ncbi:threonine-phosphate decarboxylase CobD [Magnetospira thiophila]